MFGDLPQFLPGTRLIIPGSIPKDRRDTKRKKGQGRDSLRLPAARTARPVRPPSASASSSASSSSAAADAAFIARMMAPPPTGSERGIEMAAAAGQEPEIRGLSSEV